MSSSDESIPPSDQTVPEDEESHRDINGPVSHDVKEDSAADNKKYENLHICLQRINELNEKMKRSERMKLLNTSNKVPHSSWKEYNLPYLNPMQVAEKKRIREKVEAANAQGNLNDCLKVLDPSFTKQLNIVIAKVPSDIELQEINNFTRKLAEFLKKRYLELQNQKTCDEKKMTSTNLSSRNGPAEEKSIAEFSCNETELTPQEPTCQEMETETRDNLIDSEVSPNIQEQPSTETQEKHSFE